MQEQTTVGVFLGYWLETVIRGTVRRNTYTAYRGYIENHIKRFFGDMPMTACCTEAVQQFICRLGGGAGGLSPKTVRSIVLMLKSAFGCAVDYDYVLKNPCDKVRMPKQAAREVRVFEREEQQRMEAAIFASRDKRRIGVLICLYTGLRIGELCALRWEHINFAEMTLAVRATMNRVQNDGTGKKTALFVAEPKTKKSMRTIPLPAFLCDLLKKRRDEGGVYVVETKKGKPVEPRLLQLTYKKLLAEAGVADCNFHTLRHTFATRALELGADIKSISEILGHTNSMITVNLYVHSLAAQKRKAMQGLNAYFCKKETADI
ncbi:MAG: site-specific integrase [Clostridiales bacterium]|jgi:integrase|nr:site-specific integrase [Clostridiales bacterium]